MPKIAKQDQSTIAVIGWFEQGNTGTVRDISFSLGMADDIVAGEVRRLCRKGAARVLERGGGVTIYGEGDEPIKREPVDVSAAISSQPEIVRLWNSAK